MPIPDQGFFDTEQPTDSLVSAKERKDQIREQAAEQAKAAEEAEERRKEREAEDIRQAQAREDEFVERVTTPGLTREHLLERIRGMRRAAEEAAKAPPPPVPLTPLQRQQLDAEQEAGRQAVAKAQAEWDANAAIRNRLKQEEAARQANLAPVTHPNPTQDERFPVLKSTIPDRPK